MIIGLDSAFAPNVAQAQAARASGIRLWSGYLATKPLLGLYHVWTRTDFENARLCGGTPIAFCSGWDNPVAAKALAATWNVRLCLDVEGGIRGDGPWVQGWLDKSGAGLYGNTGVHVGRRAAFHVLAWYTPNAGATWAGQRPATPCGWQWQNSHNEFGVTVDRGWYDDWFSVSNPNATAGSEVRVQEVDLLTPQQKANWLRITCQQLLGRQPTDQEGKDWATPITGELKDDGSNIDACYLKIYHTEESGNYRTALEKALAGLAGPQGPKGDKGDRGDPGPPGTSPTHFTITGTADAA